MSFAEVEIAALKCDFGLKVRVERSSSSPDPLVCPSFLLNALGWSSGEVIKGEREASHQGILIRVRKS